MIYVRLEKIIDLSKDVPEGPVGFGIGCLIEGWIGNLPTMGCCIAIVRQIRNGNASRGLFVSIPVVRISSPDAFLTVEARYHWRLEVPPTHRNGSN